LLALPRKVKKIVNSMPYGIFWVRNASLFFKAFQNGRPNWNEERLQFVVGGVFAVDGICQASFVRSA
jgi:hypothetical protein